MRPDLAHKYHFSVDDVFDSLMEIFDWNERGGIFNIPFFAFLKQIHETFDTNVDLYVFFQKEGRDSIQTLREIPSSAKAILAPHTWLRFGPHALQHEVAPYSQTPENQKKAFDAIYTEIERFSGNHSSIIRLHYFSESFELADFFHKKAVSALLSTDKDAISHRMPEYVKSQLQAAGVSSYNGLDFIRSQFRSENFANEKMTEDQIGTNIRTNFDKFGFVTFFTHEYEVSRLDVRDSTESALRCLKKIGAISL